MITENAAIALNYLWREDAVRRIWIDAVCISQRDNNERLHQVQHMKGIYRSASRVLVWLGPALQYSDSGIDLLRELAHKLGLAGQNRLPIPTQEFDVLPIGPLRALLDILGRPYWKRTWIVQEVAVALSDPVIGCGHQWLDWKTWKDGVFQLYAHKGMGGVSQPELGLPHKLLKQNLGVTYSFFDLDSLRRSFHQDPWLQIEEPISQRDRSNLQRILQDTVGKKASDPRDHIYAILGLIRYQHGIPLHRDIVPDYSKTICQVYCEAAAFALEVEETLGILQFRNHVRDPQLPSWVPNFSSQIPRYPTNAPDHWHRWSASGILRAPEPAPTARRPRVSEDLDALYVGGRVVSTIDKTLDLTGIQTKPLEIFQKIRNFAIPEASQVIAEPPRLFYLHEALWQVLVANRSPDNHIPCPGGYREAYKDLMSVNRRQEDEPSPAVRLILRAACNAICLSSSSPHRRLFLTTNGRLGLGPPDCQRGNLICVVSSCRMPLTMRTCKAYYEFVGEAYVHGIMEGQEIPAWDLGEQWTEFEIR